MRPPNPFCPDLALYSSTIQGSGGRGGGNGPSGSEVRFQFGVLLTFRTVFMDRPPLEEMPGNISPAVRETRRDESRSAD